MLRKIRPLLGLGLLLVALAVASFYLSDHRSLLHQVARTPLSVSLSVFALYALMLVVLIIILSATINVCNKRLPFKENAFINVYSLLINFFIPGQGGPVYRGIYLNRTHKLRVKNYIFVTLLYYGIYAIISTAMLLATSRPWWQTVLAAIAAAGISFVVIRRYAGRIKLSEQPLNITPKSIFYLFLATLGQAALQVVIYAVELHSVNHHISVSQVITYTGAANLALFVALTPGAIGIRESFLIFTEHLNHISSGNIVAASLIDRGVYISFLLVLIVLAITLHLSGRLTSLRAALKPAEKGSASV